MVYAVIMALPLLHADKIEASIIDTIHCQDFSSRQIGLVRKGSNPKFDSINDFMYSWKAYNKFEDQDDTVMFWATKNILKRKIRLEQQCLGMKNPTYDSLLREASSLIENKSSIYYSPNPNFKSLQTILNRIFISAAIDTMVFASNKHGSNGNSKVDFYIQGSSPSIPCKCWFPVWLSINTFNMFQSEFLMPTYSKKEFKDMRITHESD